MKFILSAKRSDRRGAMLVFVAMTIVILFVAAAFAVDIAHMHMVRAELRTATDASARAGAEALGRLQDSEAAIDVALAVAAENQVFGRPLLLSRSDVVLGHNSSTVAGAFQFTAGQQPYNAVRVTGRRVTGSPSGPVPLLFAPMFGVTRFEPIQMATASRLDRDIALVLDVSGSMASYGRFDALKNAVSVFLGELSRTEQQEYVSLSVYNSVAQNLQPLTSDLNAVQQAFSQTGPGGYTAIGLGMRVGLHSVMTDPAARRMVSKSVILMTDGNHNTGINPLNVVPEALVDRVVVHTITFSTGANQALMQAIADQTGGIHLHANSNQQLIDAFREIALTVPVTLTE